MRVCVTGCCGHLGSLLVPALLEDGHEVIGIDSFRTQRYASLLGITKPYRFIEGDICVMDLDEVFEGCDWVIHLAAITDAGSTVNNRAETWWVNFMGASRVSDSADRTGANLIFTSTTSVYGVNSGVVDESCDDFRPQSPYAESKRAAERYILSRSGQAVLRMGTVYGLSAGVRWHTAVQSFVWSAALGKPLRVWRTAMDQVRPYLYIGDFVTSVKHVLSNGLSDLWCVVTNNHTPRQIIDVIKRYRPNISVEMTDSPILNQQSYGVSSNRLKSAGWIPTGDLDMGIAQMFSALGGLHG